ncbi:hypothetical protein [Natrialbaceae archaeon AArc-T1-2]|nr:hypothetical protein [Natrialbaceae archaeon AArc-T1-2]WIV68616.1 hypothetical protein QQ977_07810 [Natrialbaceae archaeon AArc-T1-2]
MSGRLEPIPVRFRAHVRTIVPFLLALGVVVVGTLGYLELVGILLEALE